MQTNKRGQSDIVTHQTNIWNKVSNTPKGFFTTQYTIHFFNKKTSSPILTFRRLREVLWIQAQGLHSQFFTTFFMIIQWQMATFWAGDCDFLGKICVAKTAPIIKNYQNRHQDTQHNGRSLLCWVSLRWVSLCWVSRFISYAECHYDKCNSANCRAPKNITEKCREYQYRSW